MFSAAFIMGEHYWDGCYDSCARTIWIWNFLKLQSYYSSDFYTFEVILENTYVCSKEKKTEDNWLLQRNSRQHLPLKIFADSLFNNNFNHCISACICILAMYDPSHDLGRFHSRDISLLQNNYTSEMYLCSLCPKNPILNLYCLISFLLAVHCVASGCNGKTKC